MAFETVKTNLEERGFTVTVFATAAEAAEYINAQVDNTTVGIGGSMTVQSMGLYEKLAEHNEVHWHWVNGPSEHVAASTADVYLTSANGLSEAGDIINIDGAGNRVASTLFGHRKVYFIIGKNKLAPTYDEALWRARNIAAPKNAQRLGKKTPCAVNGDRCYDCKSPERICRGLVVHWGPMMGKDMEVVLVDEDLGL